MLLFGEHANDIIYTQDKIIIIASLKQLHITSDICTSSADDNDLLFNNLKIVCTFV